jgi:Ca2+-binding EF-hand superfamily protein
MVLEDDMQRMKAGLAAFLALTVSGAAAQERADIEAAFEAVDANGDGVVDIDEFMAHYIAVANDLDADDSDTLTPDELPNVDPERFALADRDRDGALSYPEVISDRVYVFYSSDTNRDGVLSLEEVLAAEEN